MILPKFLVHSFASTHHYRSSLTFYFVVSVDQIAHLLFIWCLENLLKLRFQSTLIMTENRVILRCLFFNSIVSIITLLREFILFTYQID
ncbi:Plasma membrane calcium-transporting ATPase 3 [Sarcoptes scabiei]|nr:Plasma membrane calcium-transporting ATPase 3 [Sarcoptes scabiei]